MINHKPLCRCLYSFFCRDVQIHCTVIALSSHKHRLQMIFKKCIHHSHLLKLFRHLFHQLSPAESDICDDCSFVYVIWIYINKNGFSSKNTNNFLHNKYAHRWIQPQIFISLSIPIQCHSQINKIQVLISCTIYRSSMHAVQERAMQKIEKYFQRFQWFIHAVIHKTFLLLVVVHLVYWHFLAMHSLVENERYDQTDYQR